MATHSHMTVKVEKFGPEKKLYISYFFKCIHLNRKITINRREKRKGKIGKREGKNGQNGRERGAKGKGKSHKKPKKISRQS